MRKTREGTRHCIALLARDMSKSSRCWLLESPESMRRMLRETRHCITLARVSTNYRRSIQALSFLFQSRMRASPYSWLKDEKTPLDLSQSSDLKKKVQQAAERFAAMETN